MKTFYIISLFFVVSCTNSSIHKRGNVNQIDTLTKLNSEKKETRFSTFFDNTNSIKVVNLDTDSATLNLTQQETRILIPSEILTDSFFFESDFKVDYIKTIHSNKILGAYRIVMEDGCCGSTYTERLFVLYNPDTTSIDYKIYLEDTQVYRNSLITNIQNSNIKIYLDYGERGLAYHMLDIKQDSLYISNDYKTIWSLK